MDVVHFQPILGRLGWDMLIIFAPRLHPSFRHTWKLVQLIAMVSQVYSVVVGLVVSFAGA